MWLASSVNGVDFSPFLQYGVVGVIAALGLVFMYRSYQREVKRADEADAEVKRLNQAIQDKMLPALLDSAALAREVSDLLRNWRSPPRSR